MTVPLVLAVAGATCVVIVCLTLCLLVLMGAGKSLETRNHEDIERRVAKAEGEKAEALKQNIASQVFLTLRR